LTLLIKQERTNGNVKSVTAHFQSFQTLKGIKTKNTPIDF